MRLWGGIALIFLLPYSVFAAVTISEIAWMGTKVSSNDEWIELHNNGNEAVNLDAWKITDGENLEILLTGAIGASQYAVLERTNDDSAPGEALMIYTGSLKNSGATLTLVQPNGVTEDVVEGGVNWSLIGGNNKNKETAQRIENDWVTAPATPGTFPSPELVSSFQESASKTKMVPEEALVDRVNPSMTASAANSGHQKISLWFVTTVTLLLISILSVYVSKPKLIEK